MTVIDVQVEAPQSPPVTVVRKRHVWRWIVVGVVAVLVGGLIGFNQWFAHYNPLTINAWGLFGPMGTVSKVGQPITVYDTDVINYKSLFVVRRPGPNTSFGFYVSIVNGGSLPLTLTDVTNSFADQSGVVRTLNVKVQLGSNTSGGTVSAYGPMKPTPLGSATNWQALVRTTFTVPSCALAKSFAEGSSIEMDNYQVTIKYFWFSHTITMPMQDPLVIISPLDCGVPGVTNAPPGPPTGGTTAP